MEQAVKDLPSTITVIGEIVEGRPGAVTLVDAAGDEVSPPKGGWDHFG